MKNNLTLVPAYGRDYKAINEVLKDLKENKDFIINDISCRWDNKPCNLQDLKGEYDQVTIRYSKLRKVVISLIAKFFF